MMFASAGPLQPPYTTGPDPFCSGSPSSCGLALAGLPYYSRSRVSLVAAFYRPFRLGQVTSPSLFLL